MTFSAAQLCRISFSIPQNLDGNARLSKKKSCVRFTCMSCMCPSSRLVEQRWFLPSDPEIIKHTALNDAHQNRSHKVYKGNTVYTAHCGDCRPQLLIESRHLCHKLVVGSRCVIGLEQTGVLVFATQAGSAGKNIMISHGFLLATDVAGPQT